MSEVPPPSQPPVEREHGRDPSRDSARESGRTSGQNGAPRRPRYLVVALAFSLAIGAGCWTEGCDRLAFYRGERDYSAVPNALIHDEADRARAEALYTRYTEVADEAHKRAVPMAAAIFVLGAALLTLSGRGLAGRTNTRNALVQVLVAQAIVVAASYYVTRDVRAAELDWQLEGALSQQRAALPADQYAEFVRVMDNVRRFGQPAWLALRTIVSGLIVFALTRPRSRAFFEAQTASSASSQ